MKIETPKCEVTTEVVDQSYCRTLINSLMKSKKVSLRGLAKRMKISAAYLSDLTRGNRKWSDELFQQAAKILTKQPS